MCRTTPFFTLVSMVLRIDGGDENITIVVIRRTKAFNLNPSPLYIEAQGLSVSLRFAFTYRRVASESLGLPKASGFQCSGFQVSGSSGFGG